MPVLTRKRSKGHTDNSPSLRFPFDHFAKLEKRRAMTPKERYGTANKSTGQNPTSLASQIVPVDSSNGPAVKSALRKNRKAMDKFNAKIGIPSDDSTERSSHGVSTSVGIAAPKKQSRRATRAFSTISVVPGDDIPRDRQAINTLLPDSSIPPIAQILPFPEMPMIVAQLQGLQNQRKAEIAKKVFIYGRTLGVLRWALRKERNISQDASKKELEVVSADAARTMAEIEKGIDVVGISDSLRTTILGDLQIRVLIEKRLDEITAAIVEAAEKLPVWKEFGKAILGFSSCQLGQIIGESCDLSNFRSHGCLRKRFGIIAYKDRAIATWKKSKPGLSADEWISLGYSPTRRSLIWNIGESMMKAQIRNPKGEDKKPVGDRTAIGNYGKIYIDRRAMDSARNPEMSDCHINNRAKRYMTQRFLDDLYFAWIKLHGKRSDSSVG